MIGTLRVCMGGYLHSMAKTVKEACEQFLESLGADITFKGVFPTLANVAKERGYQLHAEQRGIQGTYVYFSKDNETNETEVAG